MLVLRVKSGNEILVRHRTGSTCFLRIKKRLRRYDNTGQADFTIDVIQEGEFFTLMESLMEVDPSTDSLCCILYHNRTKERVVIRVSSSYKDYAINMVFDDSAHNFRFDRPEIWKKNLLRMASQEAMA